LSAKFGASRTTVRKAISILAQEGYLRPHQGSGTYVAHELPRRLPSPVSIGPVLHGFVDDLYVESVWARELWVSLNQVPAPVEVAELLPCAPGALVGSYFHVRGRENEPYGYAEEFFGEEVSRCLTEDLLRAEPTFLHALTRVGFKPAEMMHGFEPYSADRDVAARLNVEPGAAVIKSIGTLLDEDGEVLSVYRFFIRGGRGIQVHLIRVGELSALVADQGRYRADSVPMP